jgi:FkbM family methyltransferase
MLRALAERATHRFVFRRRLPPEFGHARLYTSTEAGLRYLGRREHFDPMLYDAARRFVRTGAVVWDIGANVGLFTMAAAARAGGEGQILAIEADTWLVELLRRTVRANSRAGSALAPISVLPVAISDDVGVAQFSIAMRSRSTNYLAGFGTTQTGGERERNLVPTLTLASLLDHFPVPDVVKIDVEGAEVDALVGAEPLLRHRPVLLCEVAAANAARVHELLHPFGYRYIDLTDNAPTALPSDNVAALPEEA